MESPVRLVQTCHCGITTEMVAGAPPVACGVCGFNSNIAIPLPFVIANISAKALASLERAAADQGVSGDQLATRTLEELYG